MIQLFDYYNQETQDLHDSLLAAGYDCPTIIIEANGFLPDDMISPYTYFLGDEEGADHPLCYLTGSITNQPNNYSAVAQTFSC